GTDSPSYGIMEESQFNKSVLPALDSFTLDADDTSLVLPPEDYIYTHSNERSFRVQQQVQLTLARKGKKTTSNGKMVTHSSLGQIGGRDFSSLSFFKENIRSPPKMVDLTPVTSPELPRSHLAYGKLSFGTCTLPGPSQPPMMDFRGAVVRDRLDATLCPFGSGPYECVIDREISSSLLSPIHRKPESKVPELTLERAVNLLGQENDEIQITAKMVSWGPSLLLLTWSDSEELERIAAGALRNVVFESSENKMEVKGVAPVMRLLRRSRNILTRRQLTGLLWNLSSHNLLKEHLSKEALEILTTSVLVPCSGLSEGENPKDGMLADPDTFYNATGCLRNISSAGPEGRKAMRQCENLIDSLVYYIRGTIADYKPDDKSTENCVCILHNLSYQVELPQKYASDLHESRLNLAPKTKTPGCFGSRSAKIIQRLEPKRPLLEKGSPSGVEWLWSAITVRMYLSIMERSICPYTQEAAIGALQNITVGNGLVSQAIAHTIVQRENGLLQAMKMLQEGGMVVKKTAVSLRCNISRYRELHAHIVKQVLPQLVVMLPNSDTSTDLPTEVTVSLCHILINLSQDETQHVRAIVNHGALPKIINISAEDNGFGPTRAGQAACILLHSMWSHSELHRAGYRKADFVNSRTSKAVH
uniref:Plakophilin 2 n=1 Tax=Oncorhynchus mykiss TaxID=8022 RepID=A0A8C7SJZ6_ONCMY